MKDSRVRVFHKKNGGVSSARQCGIDNARGEYTIHADPDDWVESNMLEDLYKEAKKMNADMVICDFYKEVADKQIYVKQEPSSLDHETVLHELFYQLHGSCWNKLVKRICYSMYEVTFPENLSFCEDFIVNVQLLRNDLKVGYLPMAYYHYDIGINENSLTKGDLKSIYFQRKSLLHYFEKYLDKPSLKPLYYLQFIRVAISTFTLDIYLPERFYEEYYNSRFILLKKAPWEWKVFLNLSAIGFLNPMRKIYLSIRRLHHLLH